MGVLTLYRRWLVSMRETVRWSSATDNSPMKGSILIALRSRVNPVLSCAQLTEILGSPEGKGVQWMVDVRRTKCNVLGDDVAEQLHFQSPCWCLSDVDIHKNDRSLCRSHHGVRRGRAGVTVRLRWSGVRSVAAADHLLSRSTTTPLSIWDVVLPAPPSLWLARR